MEPQKGEEKEQRSLDEVSVSMVTGLRTRQKNPVLLQPYPSLGARGGGRRGKGGPGGPGGERETEEGRGGRRNGVESRRRGLVGFLDDSWLQKQVR